MEQIGKPKGLGVRSPSVLSLNLFGWLLLSCMSLPLAEGCNGSTIYPMEILNKGGPWDFSYWLNSMLILGGYTNGALIGSISLLTLLLGSRRFWWSCFWIQLLFCMILIALFFSDIAWSEISVSSKMKAGLTYLPPSIGTMGWVWYALIRKDRTLAWSRLQHAWTIAAVITVHLECILATRLFFGYWLTLGALVGMVVAVEMTRHRIEHDLFDTRTPASRFKFSIKHVFVWMTIVALLMGYYQAVEPFVDWFTAEL